MAATLTADLRRLSSLLQLKRLSLCGARDLKDLGPLQALGQLEDLDLSGTGVEDISPLKKLSKLRKLSLGCKVRDLQPLSALTNLDELRLCGEGIKNLLPLVKLHKLKTLHIAWMSDLDVKAISKLPGLQKIDLRMGRVRNLASLKDLPHLKQLRLCLAGNKTKELQELRRARPDLEIHRHNGCRTTKLVPPLEIVP